MRDTEPTFEHLPILRELRDDLDAAFRVYERRGAAVTGGRGGRSLGAGRGRRRWMLPAGGATIAAAAVAAGVLALTSGVDSGHVAPAPATAAEALRQVATAAEDHPAPFPRDDQYFYVHSTGVNLSMHLPPSPATIALVTKDRRIWRSIARTGRLEEKLVGVTYPALPADRQRRGDPGEAPVSSPSDLGAARTYVLGATKLTRQQLLDYPTDPRTIYDRLLTDAGDRGHSPNGEVFTEIGDALRESPAPAALRAGLYRALALVPGVQLVGQVTDRAGRTGTAVAFTEIGIRNELVFDPATSQLLAEREVLVSPRQAELPVPAGTVIDDTVYLQRAVTDTPTEP